MVPARVAGLDQDPTTTQCSVVLMLLL
jgi:hypothetical protein